MTVLVRAGAPATKKRKKLLTLTPCELYTRTKMTILKLRNKGLAAAFSSLLVLIVASLAMVTTFTAVTYAGSCSRLAGFPGLLQKVGMLGLQPCASKAGGTICQGGTQCTAPSTKPGICHNTATSGPAQCACVEITVSQGLK